MYRYKMHKGIVVELFTTWNCYRFLSVFQTLSGSKKLIEQIYKIEGGAAARNT